MYLAGVLQSRVRQFFFFKKDIVNNALVPPVKTRSRESYTYANSALTLSFSSAQVVSANVSKTATLSFDPVYLEVMPCVLEAHKM